MTDFFYLIEFSVVYVLFMIIVPITPNWILKLSNVFLEYSRGQKDIDAIIPLCISLWSLQMSYFSSPHHILIKRPSRVHRQNQKTISCSFHKTLLHMSMWILCLRDMDRCILDGWIHYQCASCPCIPDHWHNIKWKCCYFFSLCWYWFFCSYWFSIWSRYSYCSPQRKKVALCIHCITSYLMHIFPQYCAFVSSIDSHPIPKFVSDTMSNSGWRAVMEDEMHALEQNEGHEN